MSSRRPLPPASPPSDGRGGFVLTLVVFFLFAVAVAATAGYQTVSAEFTLSQGTRQGQQARVVARAGLERFLAEQLGRVGDSVQYAIGDGIATVTTRKVLERDARNHLYLVRSRGTVTDPRTPDDPAARAVSTYAWHRIAPVPHRATIFITDKRLRVRRHGTLVSGLDASTAADCAGGGTAGVHAVATGGTARAQAGGSWVGHPAAEDESYAGWSDVYEEMNLRWDVLSDPSFPVDFDGSPPSWSSLPADSFPVSRHEGSLLAWGWSGWSGGRGVLIVTGRFKPRMGFRWDGLVLAGRLDGTERWETPVVRGMILAGMNGEQRDEDLESGLFLYDYCIARAANESLSYLERVGQAVVEVSGPASR